MRADRLVATLLMLQARERVTVAEVAAELEVSERTARRDLEALAIAGVPVYSQRGRGGGWSLVGGARTDLSGLNAAEARALFLVAGPSSNATPDVKAALRKLVRALPAPFRADADAAARAIVVDPVAWGRAGSPQPVHLDALQRAVVDGVQVRLGYAGRDRPAGVRIVHPLGLVVKGTVWYLIADTELGRRTFRVARVLSVEATGEPVVRPKDFDLGEMWRSVAAKIDELRTSARVTVHAPAGLLGPLRSVFGSGMAVGGPVPGGRIEVQVGGLSVGHVARLLLAFGNGIEVVQPNDVRAALADIGAQLVAMYGPAPPPRRARRAPG